MAAPNQLPQAFTGRWHPGGWVGIEGVAAAPTISSLLAMIFPPTIFLKLYAPFTLFFLGFCAWVFFRQLKFNPAVCLLGGVAAGLNMHFFSVACWGLGSWNIAAGMIFLSLAVLCAESIPQIWVKGILAGLALGMNLMEGFDVGAISCVYVGIFIVWQIFLEEGPGSRRVLRAFSIQVLAIVFSALMAAHSISSLVDTEVTGVVGAGQDESTKEKRWNPATQWSLPKAETLRVFIPGLFGYRMTGRITAPDKSSSYWGTVGQDPRLAIMRDDDASARKTAVDALSLPGDQAKNLESDDPQIRFTAVQDLIAHVPTIVRYSGSGEYAGIMVSVLAFFGLANSWRGSKSPYSRLERRAVWFWGGAAVFSLLAAWGRHGFLYRLLYQLPYVSTIRNPIKFMHPFHIAWLILAAYGMEALWRRYMQTSAPSSETFPLHLQKWWSKISGFEKKWAVVSLAVVAVAVAAAFIYNSFQPRLVDYLEQNGFNTTRALQVANFSATHAFWYLPLLLLSVGGVIAIVSGAWSGARAKGAWIFLGVIIILDLARSDVPWIHYFNYKQEYAENSVVDFLKDKPYEHRAVGRLSPRGLGSGINNPFGKLYDFWQQNDFAFNSIQTLDYSQWARIPMLDATYLKNFALTGEDMGHCDLWPTERLWELTNTRYFLGAAGIAPILNKYADSRHTITIKTFLKVMPKAEVTELADVGDLTAVPDGGGSYALMEFSDPLPRTRLYSSWQTPTNDQDTLRTLISHNFDPTQTVLVAQETPIGQPSGKPNVNTGTVSITDYRPKHVKLEAHATTPAVLLFNERITPQWHGWVDGKRAPLLRCNYLMRGVFLTPGDHTVEFRFQPPLTALYVSLCAWGVGILTAGYLVFSRVTAPKPIQAPVVPVVPPIPGPQKQTSVPRQAEVAGRPKRQRKR
jgi:hypothetical protein